MPEWQRVANTTIHEYLRTEEENITRNRKLLALLRSKGRITFNHSGDLMDWKVRYKRAPMRVFGESDTLTFSRVNRHKTAQLDWRGYAATDSITKMEKLKNKDSEAIIKVFSGIAKNLMADIEEWFADELYVDGNASGNEGRIHGFNSWFGYSGAAAAGYIASPSDTYAGLLTTLGNYGGSWTTVSSNVNWPDGSGDPEYDFWSPLIVDYTDASWAATTDNWANNCVEALRYAILNSTKNRSKRGMLDVNLLTTEMYRLYLEKQEAKEQIHVTRGDQAGSLYSLGFKDVTNQEGVEVTSEYGVPTGEGFGLCIDELELCSLQGTLFVAEVPDFDIASQSDRFSIDFFGNMRGNPRYQVKYKNVT